MAGNNYYRIRAVKTDGGYLISKIVTVKIGMDNSGFQVFPNPVTNHQININAAYMAKGQYQILLYNQQGQKVLSQLIDHAGGAVNKLIGINSMLPEGVYYLQINGGIEK